VLYLRGVSLVMATTVHEPPQIDPRRLPRQRQSGNGDWGNLRPSDGNVRVALEYSPPPSSTAIWVVLFAVTMMFAAFSSALIVRKGSSLDWQGFALPSILYFNTLVLIVSSLTLEVARRRVTTFMGGGFRSRTQPVGCTLRCFSACCLSLDSTWRGRSCGRKGFI